jgi:hypothetical protein
MSDNLFGGNFTKISGVVGGFIGAISGFGAGGVGGLLLGLVAGSLLFWFIGFMLYGFITTIIEEWQIVLFVLGIVAFLCFVIFFWGVGKR